MKPTSILEKLSILLPHWIEHNLNHQAEFEKWAAAARTEGAQGLATLLDQAASNMRATDEILRKAQSDAGSPPSGDRFHSHAAHSHGNHAHHHHD